MLADVNVLLALAWPNHQHHGAARAWFDTQRDSGWSTCAITELGFIRVSSHKAFTEHAKTPAEAALLIAALTGFGRHRYLDELPSPASAADWGLVAGPKQVTDAYLVAIARHHGTRLATFDARIRSNPSLAEGVVVIA